MPDTKRTNDSENWFAEYNACIFALEDNFESIYDVELESGNYSVYVKGEFYRNIVIDKLIKPTNYFTDLKENIDSVIYPDDREGLYNVMKKEAILKQLSEKDHYDYFYRAVSDNGPVWLKVRIVYKNDEKKNIIIGVFDATRELAEKELESRKRDELIDRIVSECNGAFTVNMSDDSFIILRMDDNFEGKGHKFNNFTEAKQFFISNPLHPSDKELISRELEYDTIRNKLRYEKTYSVEYRVFKNGATLWHKMTVTGFGDDEVVLGFAEKNAEITKRRLEDKRYDEYLALFMIDMDTGMIQPVLTSPLFKTAKVGEAVPYEASMKLFAATYEGEAKEFFDKMSELEYVRNELATDDKRTFSFRSSKLGENKWIDVISYVVLRHDDGTPAMFSLGFSLVDSLATVRKELLSRLNEDMQMIGGLASGYYALYYFNIDEGFFKIYSLDGKRYPKAAKIAGEGGNPVSAFMKFGMSELVHPDDRHLFINLSVDALREKLAHSKKFSVPFRRNYNGEYRWSELDVVKYEAIDERANVIVVGFADRDESIRSEQTLKNCFTVLTKEIPPYEAINELLSDAGTYYGAERCYIFEYAENNRLLNNTYEWCADGIEAMISHLQNIPSSEIEGWTREFRAHGAFYMDALDVSGAYGTEEGRALLEMQGIESLIAAPIMNGDEIVGFIGVDNPTKAKKNINVLKNIAVVAYSEILKRRENDEEHITLAKLADTFASVYFTDLATDYMRTWKIADIYREAYGSVRNYSVSMGGYVRNNIAERDRERCIRMTSPEYILEQFKTKDRFSVPMTDTLTGEERSIIFDFIKVNDEGTQFVVCARDVTESVEREKENQKQLEEARIIAETANKSKTNFLFNMSHDIRTPMNAITGFTKMAKKYADDREKVNEYLDKIETSGQQLLSLVNQVLEMARIESGKAELDLKPVNIYEEYNALVTVLSEQAKSSGLAFYHSLSDVTHGYVLADKARMSSVTFNITGNAMKYTPSGGSITFLFKEIAARKEGYATFVLTVSDTGIGMSEEYMKILYEPFSREKSSTVSKIQGTGLGMSIVKELLNLMGGDIEVHSEEGKGTRFDVTVDFEIVRKTAVENEKVSPGKNPLLKGRRVLLVEDNELNSEIACDILEEEGLIVENADDGTKAVAIMEENGPDYYDFILMDVQMPVMNGYEATKRIRAMYPEAKIPIIALSANAFAEDKSASIAAGMDDHVAKPIDPSELFDVLVKYL